ncbi:MAG: DUF5053 domain-containing protein, partial [Candidatus Symbiothrix sp.]|nr:DUF5053 domain-containing protein [Candidatus Symbiothrix sp.]
SKETGLRQELSDIILDISWAKIAKRYFDKSPSWIYHKIDGIDGNGKPTVFLIEERVEFKNALYDLSERIRNTANKI